MATVQASLAHAESELSRLREHLLAVQKDHDRDLLDMQQQQDALQHELESVRLAIQQSLADGGAASRHAEEQINVLRHRIAALVEDKDDAVTQLREAQQQRDEMVAAMGNLQAVLERLRLEAETQLAEATDRARREARDLRAEADMLRAQLAQPEVRATRSYGPGHGPGRVSCIFPCSPTHAAQQRAAAANRSAEEAARLQLDLEERDQTIASLQSENRALQEHLRNTHRRLNQALVNCSENTIDRCADYAVCAAHEAHALMRCRHSDVMKSLFLSYFKTTHRDDVLRIIANMLNFTASERQLVGLDRRSALAHLISLGSAGAAISSAVRPAGDAPDGGKFSELFVQFLLDEARDERASPKPQHDTQQRVVPPVRHHAQAEQQQSAISADHRQQQQQQQPTPTTENSDGQHPTSTARNDLHHDQQRQQQQSTIAIGST